MASLPVNLSLSKINEYISSFWFRTCNFEQIEYIYDCIPTFLIDLIMQYTWIVILDVCFTICNETALGLKGAVQIQRNGKQIHYTNPYLMHFSLVIFDKNPICAGQCEWSVQCSQLRHISVCRDHCIGIANFAKPIGEFTDIFSIFGSNSIVYVYNGKQGAIYSIQGKERKDVNGLIKWQRGSICTVIVNTTTNWIQFQMDGEDIYHKVNIKRKQAYYPVIQIGGFEKDEVIYKVCC